MARLHRWFQSSDYLHSLCRRSSRKGSLIISMMVLSALGFLFRCVPTKAERMLEVQCICWNIHCVAQVGATSSVDVQSTISVLSVFGESFLVAQFCFIATLWKKCRSSMLMMKCTYIACNVFLNRINSSLQMFCDGWNNPSNCHLSMKCPQFSFGFMVY